MKKKKVILTGGLGFIGSNLIELLIKKNFYVINIDKISYSSNFYNVKDFNKNKNYKFIKCDINNKLKICKILSKEKPLALFNLAAESHVDRSIDSPYSFIKNNIIGVFNLLEAIRDYYSTNKNFRFIHISTDEVYGALKRNETSFTEQSNFKPNSPYSASKASSDLLVRSWIKTYNYPAIITNCSNNFGPWQHPEKLIPHIISCAILKKKIPIYGNGQNERDWLHVSDHVNALIHISKFGKIGEKYNIGLNKSVKNIKLVKQICKILDKKIPENFKYETLIHYVKDRKGHDFKYAVNSSKLKKLKKFKYLKNLNVALIETIQWNLDNKSWLIKSFNKKFK